MFEIFLKKKTSLKKQKKRFERYQKDKNKKFFTVCHEDNPIGVVGISNISKENKNADLFIMIGEDNYRGKGIWRLSMKRIIAYGFNTLKLHKLSLWVIEKNIPAVKLYQSLGFITEGNMKDEVYFEGEFHNFLSMAIFKTK